MNLKEIREKKGLTQSECASILGISRRTYQNLEKDDVDTFSQKYQRYCQILDSFNSNYDRFLTNVAYGKDLTHFKKSVEGFKTRFCYQYLLDYIQKDNYGKVCILFGLRRTGKTTLLFQLLNELNLNETAYIKVNENNTMGDLVKDINILKDIGIKNFLIDEITLLDDFINTGATLSDIYAMMGLKIILSGTDSLGFSFSSRDELFDRNIMIHTSYISFKEFYEVLGIKDIDKYIEYGGTFKIENISFDDPDYQKEEVAFKDDESTRKYIDTAICKNIQRTLRNNKFGGEFYHLKELYEKNELTNVINRIIENMNHDFLLSVILDTFKSHDLGSARQLLLKNNNPIIQTALYDVDEEAIIKRLKEIIEVKEKEELSIEVDQLAINQLKQYLSMLDLVREIDYCYDDGSSKKHVVFTQPGMRYSLTKALVYSLMQDSYFNSISQIDKDIITNKIISDVKGRMLEDIVLLEKSIRKNSSQKVFKYKSITGGEIDMVIYDNSNNMSDIYEIKHSNQISFDNQTKFLRNDEIINSLKAIYGDINNKYVLYRGKSCEINDIKYLNVEDYLMF